MSCAWSIGPSVGWCRLRVMPGLTVPRRWPRLPAASWHSVLLIRDIVAGHGRLAAARQLGLAEVPVILLAGLTEVQRRQLMLADNRIALNAGWNAEMLNLELKELSILGADLE